MREQDYIHVRLHVYASTRLPIYPLTTGSYVVHIRIYSNITKEGMGFLFFRLAN